MTEKLVLVTGACGEMGQALIQGLARRDGYQIVTSDLSPLPERVANAVSRERGSADTNASPLPALVHKDPMRRRTAELG